MPHTLDSENYKRVLLLKKQAITLRGSMGVAALLGSANLAQLDDFDKQVQEMGRVIDLMLSQPGGDQP